MRGLGGRWQLTADPAAGIQRTFLWVVHGMGESWGRPMISRFDLMVMLDMGRRATADSGGNDVRFTINRDALQLEHVAPNAPV